LRTLRSSEERFRATSERLQQSLLDLESARREAEHRASLLKSQAVELEQARDSALASIHARSDVLASMSQEIRTPMNGILGMCDLLAETPLSEVQRDYVRSVHASVESLLTVVNDILDYSKIEAGEVGIEAGDLNMRTLLEETADLFAAAAHERGIEIVCCVPRRFPEHLRGDSKRIQQVLGNLVGNAVKFTERGEVVVEAHLIEESPISARVSLSVRDTGIGIPADLQKGIFEAFTKGGDGSGLRKRGGLGLGLSISRKLAELMGGVIGFASETGKGSTFWLELPLAKREGAVAASVGIPPRGVPGLRVLAILPSRANRRAISAQLRAWGCRPRTTPSVEAGMRILRSSNGAKPYDLIFLDDPILPSGVDADDAICRNLRTEGGFGGRPIILITRIGARPTPEALRARGFDGLLTKPVKIAALLKAILDSCGASERRAASPTDETRTGRPTIPAGLRVLLAEASSVSRKVILQILDRRGCRAEGVTNGRDAVAAVATGAFDAVLMDLRMAEMDGLEATAEIRRIEAEGGLHTPIIGMLPQASDADRERCLAAGMDDCLAKPMRPKDIFETLALWTDRGKRAESAKPSRSQEPGLEARRYDGRLRREYGLDPESEREVIQEFLASTGDRFARIAASIEGGDCAPVVLEAHAVKGSSRTIGDEILGEICQALEHAARRGETVSCRVLLARARIEFDIMRDDLIEYIGQKAA
jgi:signal transduction histidine kinase/DNA-binding response OmpR family regulator